MNEETYERWIQGHMNARITEYSDLRQLKIFCGSWNVNARKCNDNLDDLSEWLLPNCGDIYAITLQEIVQLNVTNVLLSNEPSEEAVKYWIHKIYALLHEGNLRAKAVDAEFVLLREVHMAGLLLFIFIKESILPFVDDVRDVSVRTGVFNVLGNKGGVSIRFNVFDSTFCFVGSHFHANVNNVAVRNLDYNKILAGAIFPPNNCNSTNNSNKQDFAATNNISFINSLCLEPSFYSTTMETTDSDFNDIIPPISTIYPQSLSSITPNSASQSNVSDENTTSTDPLSLSTTSNLNASNTTNTNSTNSSNNSIAAKFKSKNNLEKFRLPLIDKAVSILDHEFVFWMGDLNYRLIEDPVMLPPQWRMDSNYSSNGGKYAINNENGADNYQDDSLLASTDSADFDANIIPHSTSARSEFDNINNDDTDAIVTRNNNSQNITISSHSNATKSILSACSRGEFGALVPLDQLGIERAKAAVFQGFLEGPLLFAPTYKYQPGTAEYESREEKKKLRAPAWCDRILWKVLRADAASAATLLHYGRAEVCSSDHKPVRAFFSCEVRAIDLEKMRVLYEGLLNRVDEWVNASRPRLEILQPQVDFGAVRCYEKVVRNLTLRNSGQSMLQWWFVSLQKDEEGDKEGKGGVVGPRWLTVSPVDGVLAPNELAIVQVELSVDATSALAIVEGFGADQTFENILVLRVDGGSDFFVVFTGCLLDSAQLVREQYTRYVLPPQQHRPQQSGRIALNDTNEEEEKYEELTL